MNDPIKVLYMLHDSRRSGVPAVASAIIMALNGSSLTPSVLFAYDGVYVQELRDSGVDVHAFAKRRPFIWRLNRFLFNVRLLKLARKVDIVHIHSTKLAFSVLVAKWLGARVVFHVHELPGKVGPLLRKAIGMADCVVFCSKTCEAHYTGISAKCKRTIVNAMSFPATLPARPQGVGKKVVMVGSINKNKGQDLLLQAFARLRERDAELWLYGTTGLSALKYVHDLKQFAEKQGIAARVFFPGPTSDVFRVFAEASVVVHTSWTESFGMALAEAQSCGVPVVAHDLEGMREVVVDGVTGFLVKPGNIDILAARIDELLANPDLREQMGAAGYKMVRERFDITSRVEEYMELYTERCRL